MASEQILSIEWYCPEKGVWTETPKADGYHVALGVEWHVKLTGTQVVFTPVLYRWDSENTNDGSVYAYNWGKYKDSSIPFGAGKYTRKLKTLPSITFDRLMPGTEGKLVYVNYAWGSAFGTTYGGKFHKLGSGSVKHYITIPPRDTCTISYDLNGGQNPKDFPNQEKTYGIDIKVNPKTPTKDGYDFLGWDVAWDEQSNHPHYFPGGTIAYNKDQTLTALWQLSPNVNHRENDIYKPARMWVKENGEYKTGILYTKKNGVYVRSII